jgi:hypothetical protein
MMRMANRFGFQATARRHRPMAFAPGRFSMAGWWRK